MVEAEHAPDETLERRVRDEDGAIDAGFVEQVSQAVLLSDVTTLREPSPSCTRPTSAT